jgi:muramoyltetrapeptide carboxypeptidase LdcA involved in peptidoglycan recycling
MVLALKLFGYADLTISPLSFSREVHAVTIAYGALLGDFTGKIGAIKTQLNASLMSTVADGTEAVFPRHAAHFAVGAASRLHFGAFLAGNSANANFHN